MQRRLVGESEFVDVLSGEVGHRPMVAGPTTAMMLTERVVFLTTLLLEGEGK